LVFEHRDGIDPEDKVTAPNKRVIWQSPKEFANMLQARVAWEVSNPNATAADRKKAPPYPRLVLGVIEEKVRQIALVDERNYLLIMTRNPTSSRRANSRTTTPTKTVRARKT
jgi:hypothetical protein